MSWLVFAPGAVFLGWIARAHGVDAADWTLAVIAALVGTLLVRASIRRSEPIVESVPAVADEAGDLDCRTLEDLVTDHLDGRLDPGNARRSSGTSPNATAARPTSPKSAKPSPSSKHSAPPPTRP